MYVYAIHAVVGAKMWREVRRRGRLENFHQI